MVLVYFKGQLIRGCKYEAPVVYVLTENSYLIEWQGKQYIGLDSINCNEVKGRIFVNDLKMLSYVGSYDSEDGIYYIYTGDSIIGLKIKQKGNVEIYTDIERYIFGDVEVYCSYMGLTVDEDQNKAYLIYYYGKGSIVIDKNNGSIIEFDCSVSKEIFQAAEKVNKIDVLQKLCKLAKSIQKLGKFNLRKSLAEKDSNRFYKLCEVLEDEGNQELIFNNINQAVMNVRKALLYVNEVEGWKGNFEAVEVRIKKDEVVICENYIGLASFKYAKSLFIGLPHLLSKELNKIRKLCQQYSLCSKLSEEGLKEWAKFLKVVKVVWV